MWLVHIIYMDHSDCILYLSITNFNIVFHHCIHMSMSATIDYDPEVDIFPTPSKALSLDSNIEFERLEDIPSR